MMQTLVEPLSLCSTLGEDKSRPLPLVGAKGVGRKQLAQPGSSSSDGGDFGGDPITFCKQGVVHAWSLRCTGDNSSAECGNIGAIAL